MDNTLFTGTSIPVSELMETPHSKEIPVTKILAPLKVVLGEDSHKSSGTSLPYSPHINPMYASGMPWWCLTRTSHLEPLPFTDLFFVCLLDIFFFFLHAVTTIVIAIRVINR